MTYLKDSYQKFRANPRNAPLASNVSLIYVPSTTRIDGAEAVATHVSRQSAAVKKKSENIISAIESSDSLCLDIETTLEFLEGGGAYLPSFDDNFLADRVVTIPMVKFPENLHSALHGPQSVLDNATQLVNKVLTNAALALLAPHCPLQRRTTDPASANLLGSGLSAQGTRSHRCSRS